MNILKKIFLIIFFVAVLLFVVFSVYIHKYGKTLIEEKLSHALKKEVHVGKARVLFPLGLRFDNVEIKDALTAKVMRVKFGVPPFVGGQFNVSKVRLTEPVFLLTRTTDKNVVWGKVLESATPSEASTVLSNSLASQTVTSPKSASSLSQGILIDYLEVEEGTVKFFDSPRNSEIDIGQINLRALSITLPAKNLSSKFDFSAVVLTDNVPFSGRKIEARGMVNMVAHDMDASFKMTDPDGNSGISARFKSVNNDMVVKGKINVGRFISEVRTKTSKESSWEGLLTNALQSSGVEIGLDFTCQTKMNDFNCDKISMTGNVVQTEAKP